jgi:hypothetical protein
MDRPTTDSDATADESVNACHASHTGDEHVEQAFHRSVTQTVCEPSVTWITSAD